jgi:hypothetical protein
MSTQVTTTHYYSQWTGKPYIRVRVYRNFFTRLLHLDIGHATIDPDNNTFVLDGIQYGGKGYRSLREAEQRAVEFIEQKARN